MSDQTKAFGSWSRSRPGVPWRQLILGVLVPINLFYALHRLGHPLTGALLAIGWSLGLLVFTYWRKQRMELFPALAIPIVLIELIGTLITRNADFYLASAAIENALWGFLFISSLLFTRTLIQIFAELLDPDIGSPEFFSHFEIPVSLYRSAWKILTLIWAVVSFGKVFILVMSQLKLPLEIFLIVRSAYRDSRHMPNLRETKLVLSRN